MEKLQPMGLPIEGYYFVFDRVRNGMGGSRPISLRLRHDALGIDTAITDDDGNFLHFPGVMAGDWQHH